MLAIISTVVNHAAPIFLVASPITSYADQIYSIHKNKSSDGFSLDIPLIMLVCSILKVFYWFGAYYDPALLIQACLMIVVQMVLLKVALDNRPSPGASGGIEHVPFTGYSFGTVIQEFLTTGKMPYNFWRWTNAKPYYRFLAYFTAPLLVIHVFLPFISRSPTYIALLGGVGLAIEAMLPVPQIIKNHNARSCKGFRVSVIANWLAGDTMKMSYFFLSKEYIPWAFRLCGIFQSFCDAYLAMQYYFFDVRKSSMKMPWESGLKMTEINKPKQSLDLNQRPS